MKAMIAATLEALPAKSNRFVNLLLLSLLSTGLLLADDFLQQLVSTNNHATLQVQWALSLFALNLCLWACGKRWFVNGVLALFALMQLMQLSHIAAIGRSLTPADIALILVADNLREIALATQASLGAHWPSLIAWALPYAGAFVLFNLGMKRVPLPRKWWAALIVLAALASKPYSASHRPMPSFLPSPTRSSLHNSINAFSFYGMHARGNSIRTFDIAYKPYRINERTRDGLPDDIWLVVFDTVRTDRLGFAGYGRDTTPNLSRWINDGEVEWRRGISGSVATSAAITLLLNTVHEPGNMVEIRRHAANPMRLAKQHGYTTHWLSTQTTSLLSGMDVSDIDVIKAQEDALLQISQHRDDAMLSMLDQHTWGKRNFVVIMLRTAHMPYIDNYRHRRGEFARWPDGKELPMAEQQGNSYDNSLLYMDSVMAQLRQRFDQRSGSGILVMTSDHGEMLGEAGVFGHNVLTPEVINVPILVHHRGAGKATRPPLPDGHVSHYQLGKWLIGNLGFDLENPNEQPGVHYVQGSNFYSDNLFMPVTSDGLKLVLGKPSSLSAIEKQQRRERGAD